MALEDLYRLLAEIGITPFPDEVADVLWLAMLSPPRDPDPASTAPAAHAAPRGRRGSSYPVPQPKEDEGKEDGAGQPGGRPGIGGGGRLHLRLPGESVPGPGRAAVPVSTSAALPSLALMRALRPLRGYRVVGGGTTVDEEATADRSAEQRLLLPVLEPASEPAFDLAVVIDASESMELWSGHVREFRALCEHLSAFRDIRTWYLLAARDGQPGVALRGASPAAALRHPRELIEPSGRRLILVLTDGVHPGWLPSGPLRAVLAQWNTVSPVAVVQMFPQRLWERSALQPGLARFSATNPGQVAAELIRSPYEEEDDVPAVAGRGVAVPVLELAPGVLNRWARLISGSHGVATLAAAALPGAGAESRRTGLSDFFFAHSAAEPADPAEAAKLVRGFRTSVSAEAYKLAGYLSVVAPLDIPVMRLILETKTKNAGAAELAEVFLGGLLRRLPPRPGGGADATVPGGASYGFPAATRQVLQATVTRDQAVGLLDQVGTYLMRRQWGGHRPFSAIAENPVGGDIAAAAEQYPPFARVASEVFAQMGGPFTEAARQLSLAAQAVTTGSHGIAPSTDRGTVIVAVPGAATVTPAVPAGQPTGERSGGDQEPGGRHEPRDDVPLASSSTPPSPSRLRNTLRFRRVSTGEEVEVEGTVQATPAGAPAGEFLTARLIRLDDGTDLRQHRPVTGIRRPEAYDRLDNEILAGRRLWQATAWDRYPAEVAQLYGDEAMSSDPYALFEPYRGRPLRDVASILLDDELEQFQTSLLTGLCWLASAGIVHRAISPDTVLWDSAAAKAQLIDLSRSALFGAPREPINGSPDWVPRELRPDTVYGYASDQDDIWAAGRLIFYARSRGENLSSRDQLATYRLEGLLASVFSPPEERPTARQLLTRLNARVRLPQASRPSLDEVRRPFFAARARKHPVPPESGGGTPPRLAPADGLDGSALAAHAPRPGTVVCPFCLNEISDWNLLPLWRWDANREEYAELRISAGLSSEQMIRQTQGTYIRCPNTAGLLAAHYLPANYGRYGAPVILGLTGLPASGKTHLLAAMIHLIQSGELARYGLQARPLDRAVHQKFVSERIAPLFRLDEVLWATSEGTANFAEGFLIRAGDGPERPVVFFDVAVEDIAGTRGVPPFFWIVDGMFFVIDPDRLAFSRAGDETFDSVLDVIRDRAQPGSVSAAIVLAKADKVKFDDPVARWLRADGSLDDGEVLAESADVYAYLQDRQAGALTAPYEVCESATLHVTSATGSAPDQMTFPRGVTPRGVLRPLLAMLAMTGVLTGPQVESIGR